MRPMILIVLLSIGIPVSAFSQVKTMTQSANALAHVSNRFTLTVHAPFREAALLFGPESERKWAGGDWDPQFVFPQPGEDVQGAVFTIQHESHQSVWVNTQFDVKRGRFQYVYFVPEILVTTIEVRLSPAGPAGTKVEVTYTRTALQKNANDDVRALGERDRDSGKHWQESINAYLMSWRH
jgi:hypothetical protein